MFCCVADLHYCSRHQPCLNGGTCVSSGVGYRCVCVANFTGATCERAHCSTCFNDGLCDVSRLATGSVLGRIAYQNAANCCRCSVQLSMGWVDPWVGLGQDFSLIGRLGWVHYSKSTKIWKDCVNAFKARLDKIWLYQSVKFISCIFLGRVGSNFFHL